MCGVVCVVWCVSGVCVVCCVYVCGVCVCVCCVFLECVFEGVRYLCVFGVVCVLFVSV